MEVVNHCKNYFNGFQEIQKFKHNDAKTNALAILKILSYFTGVIPLGFAAVYGAASLYGRVNKKEQLSDVDKRITDQAQHLEIQVNKQWKDSTSIKNFIESISAKADHADVLIKVSFINAPVQLIKFDNFDNLMKPRFLFGNNYSNNAFVQIPASSIQSIEIMSKIGDVVDEEDKKKLAALGITFDQEGIIQIPEENFSTKIIFARNNQNIQISTKDGHDIVLVSVNRKEIYCHCFWSD